MSPTSIWQHTQATPRRVAIIRRVATDPTFPSPCKLYRHFIPIGAVREKRTGCGGVSSKPFRHATGSVVISTSVKQSSFRVKFLHGVSALRPLQPKSVSYLHGTNSQSTPRRVVFRCKCLLQFSALLRRDPRCNRKPIHSNCGKQPPSTQRSRLELQRFYLTLRVPGIPEHCASEIWNIPTSGKQPAFTQESDLRGKSSSNPSPPYAP